MTVLGSVSLWLALLVAVWGAVVGTLGIRIGAPALERSAARAPALLAALLAVTCLSLMTGLIRFDPRMTYVIENAHRALPDGYRALGLITSPEGSMLACLLVAAVATAFLQWTAGQGHAARAATGIPLLALAAGLIVVILSQAPFAVLDAVPVDGVGPDPRLRHPLLAVGPPFVLAGGALGLAAWSARLGAAITRGDPSGPTLVGRLGALALTAGLCVSAWWSYHTAGWGIGWIPIDAAVAPWLVLLVCAGPTASRARLDLPLTALAALLVLAGLFAVPDALAPRSSAFGPSAAGAGVVAVAGLPLMLPFLLARATGRALEADSSESPSRGLRLGARVAALGGALVAVAALAAGLGPHGREVQLDPGDTARVERAVGGSYSIRHLDVSSFSELNYVTHVAGAHVSRGRGAPRFLSTEWRQYVDVTGHPLGGPVVRPGTHHGLIQDLQLEFAHVTADDTAHYRVRAYPLVPAALIGGGLLLVGSAMMALSGRSA